MEPFLLKYRRCNVVLNMHSTHFYHNFVTLKHSSRAEKLFSFNFDSLKSKMSCLNVRKSVNENRNSYISPSNCVDVNLKEENDFYRFESELHCHY